MFIQTARCKHFTVYRLTSCFPVQLGIIANISVELTLSFTSK